MNPTCTGGLDACGNDCGYTAPIGPYDDYGACMDANYGNCNY